MKELLGQPVTTVDHTYETIIEDVLDKGYSIIDNFLSPSTVALLRNDLLWQYDDDQFKKAAIGNHTNEVIKTGIRGDFILWMDETTANGPQKLFFERINDMVQYLNRTCYLGIFRKEFHYALYPEGKFYKRHLDAFQNDDRIKLSIVCYLNEDDWQPEHGGELVIYLKDKDAGEKPLNIYPFPGRAVIFESRVLEHEVKPANRERLSITGWLKTQ